MKQYLSPLISLDWIKSAACVQYRRLLIADFGEPQKRLLVYWLGRLLQEVLPRHFVSDCAGRRHGDGVSPCCILRCQYSPFAHQRLHNILFGLGLVSLGLFLAGVDVDKVIEIRLIGKVNSSNWTHPTYFVIVMRLSNNALVDVLSYRVIVQSYQKKRICSNLC